MGGPVRRLGTAAAVIALMVSGLSAESLPEEDFPGPCQDDAFANGINLWRAVSQANENGAPDVIDLVAGCTYQVPTTIRINPDPKDGNASELTIHGNGATIKRSPRSPDESPFRVIDLLPGAKLNLDHVAVSGGRTVAGDGGGGGIRVGYEGLLILADSELRFNASPDEGAALAVYGSAGVIDSTVRGNKAAAKGSILANNGRLEMAQSTLSGNEGETGSSLIRSMGFAALANVTITENEGQAQVLDNAGELYVAASTIVRNAGIGILNKMTAMVRGSIVADNGGASCDGEKITGGPNLTHDQTCPGITGPRLLGQLADNGGPTQTRALRTGSAAINPGPCNTSGYLHREFAVDQRGVTRDASCDFGAFEVVDADGDGLDDGVQARLG